MFAVCTASVPLAELELESLFWPAGCRRYKPLTNIHDAHALADSNHFC